ncbi:hypothetical protein ACFVSU_15015 [Microbacterium sp. NPDC058062]|uniref:hypothetical protein n=1 Tax=Microbacterium sp. NPDC058062 TaxID=3346320 RepID=UPI0036DEC075
MPTEGELTQSLPERAMPLVIERHHAFGAVLPSGRDKSVLRNVPARDNDGVRLKLFHCGDERVDIGSVY